MIYNNIMFTYDTLCEFKLIYKMCIYIFLYYFYFKILKIILYLFI